MVSVRGVVIDFVEPDFCCVLLHTETQRSQQLSKIEAGGIRLFASTYKLGATQLTGALTAWLCGTLFNSRKQAGQGGTKWWLVPCA
jgi:hypothetical protein